MFPRGDAGALTSSRLVLRFWSVVELPGDVHPTHWAFVSLRTPFCAVHLFHLLWIFRHCFLNFSFVCNYVKCPSDSKTKSLPQGNAQDSGCGTLLAAQAPDRGSPGGQGGAQGRWGQKRPWRRHRCAPHLSICVLHRLPGRREGSS